MSHPTLPRLTSQCLAADFRLPAGALYIHGSGEENRSSHIESWQSNSVAVDFLPLTPVNPSEVVATVSGVDHLILLRSRSAWQPILTAAANRPVYVDITALAHHVWAPLIRVLASQALMLDTHIIYAEPLQYVVAPNAHSELFQLSDKLGGIAPLPGFAAFAPVDDGALVIPMLGFEGSRFRHLLTNLEPAEDKILPILGVPGFEHTYPMYSYLGNHLVLEEEFRFLHVRYARSNCPFDAAICLMDIADSYPLSRLQIAPIGTKPHALAAVLFAIANPDLVEIVYDHPVRSAGRTAGTGSLCQYPLAGLLEALEL